MESACRAVRHFPMLRGNKRQQDDLLDDCGTDIFSMSTLHTESAVRERYAAGAHAPEAKLCCPVDYNPEFLKVIPQEVIERDYGCGDPSRYLRAGETVLDLGSGTGKICFIAAQVVGPNGRVIGVDMTDDMLKVARSNAPIVAERIGYSNVEFRKGRIQDLALDLEKLDEELKARPITDAASFLRADELAQELRVKHPLIASESVDVVVSNCVLNLVEAKAKRQLFDEIFRVLKIGGRAVISDIVSDEEVPAHLQNDAELWSGCISGALTEEGFLQAFSDAGFYGIQILKRDEQPWQTVEGIEFRSVTIEAFKGKQGPCVERNQAVIYKGPFREILDDDNHRMERGKRYAVCDKTYNIYRKAPYAASFEFIEPLTPVPVNEAKPFDCSRTALRHPKETKGHDYTATTEASQCCDGGSCC
jgi:ubiquinone/menaquinone biosynthesis C-methylase UbiE